MVVARSPPPPSLGGAIKGRDVIWLISQPQHPQKCLGCYRSHKYLWDWMTGNLSDIPPGTCVLGGTSLPSSQGGGSMKADMAHKSEIGHPATNRMWLAGAGILFPSQRWCHALGMTGHFISISPPCPGKILPPWPCILGDVCWPWQDLLSVGPWVRAVSPGKGIFVSLEPGLTPPHRNQTRVCPEPASPFQLDHFLTTKINT